MRDVKQLVRMAGYVGARTVVSTHSFEIPADFMEWHATCHHNDPELMELARKFCQGPAFGASLFYLWGHAYEFDGDGNWSVIEEFLGYVSQFEKEVWFAGNTELADYVTAFRQRVYSADGSRIYNPTATAIWIQVGTQIHEIPAGSHGEGGSLTRRPLKERSQLLRAGSFCVISKGGKLFRPFFCAAGLLPSQKRGDARQAKIPTL